MAETAKKTDFAALEESIEAAVTKIRRLAVWRDLRPDQRLRLAERLQLEVDAPGSPGRPAVDFDLEHLTKLAARGSTMKDVAFWYNCSERTVQRYLEAPDEGERPSSYFRAWSEGQGLLKMSLRSAQCKMALGSGKGAAQMLIHMSKHQLGETDAAAAERAHDDEEGRLSIVIER